MNKFSKSGGILNIIGLVASGIFQGLSLFVLLLMLDIANTANDITTKSIIWSAFLVFCFIILLLAIIFTIISLIKNNKDKSLLKNSTIITTIIFSIIAMIPNIYYMVSMDTIYIIVAILVTLPIIIANILIIRNLIKYNKLEKVSPQNEN